MSEAEKVPTAGVQFFDLRHSPMKLVSVIDIPAVTDVAKTGANVNVSGGNGKVYGPYRLDREFSRGNGQIVFVAFSIGANGTRSKPLSKAELEQLATNQAAELETLKLQMAELTARGKK